MSIDSSPHIDDIQINNGYLYVTANHDGLSKWDITDPTSPVLIDEIVPDSLSEAAYDMSFRGDSIFLTYKKSIAVVQDAGSSLNVLTKFAY